MRILTFPRIYFCSLALIITTSFTYGQDKVVAVNQDPKFEQLLLEKRKLNSALSADDTYKIQIFSGNSEEAKRTLKSFKKEFVGVDATIIFNTPNYKVWVGNFKTRIEAERNLIEIRKRYMNVHLIRPTR